MIERKCIIIGVWLLFILSPTIIAIGADENSLSVDLISPLTGIIGNDLNVHITGSGFGANTRISLVPASNTDVVSLDADSLLSGVSAGHGECSICEDVSVIKAYDNLLFFGRHFEGKRIVDITDAIHPIVVGEIEIRSIVRDIIYDRHFVYLVSYDEYGFGNDHHWIDIVDCSDLSNPVDLGFVGLGGNSSVDYQYFDGIYDLETKNDYLIVAGGRSGLFIFDRRLQSFNAPKIAVLDQKSYGIAISGDYAYIAAGVDGMSVIDVSNPESPSVAGLIDKIGDVRDVSVSGRAAYVINRSNGFKSIDISHPLNPVLISTLRLPKEVRKIEIDGGFAWVFDSPRAAYFTIDIHQPSSPVLMRARACGRATVSGKVIFSATDNCIELHPRPFDIPDVNINSQNSLTCTIPSPAINTGYRILASNENQSVQSGQVIRFELTAANPDDDISPDGPAPDNLDLDANQCKKDCSDCDCCFISMVTN